MSSFVTQIDIDAEITVSELRSEELFDQRLHDHAALRLRRRNDLLGVIISTERWKSIEETIRQLTAALEKLEDAATLALIDQRETSVYAPLTDESWSDVERQYKQRMQRAPDEGLG